MIMDENKNNNNFFDINWKNFEQFFWREAAFYRTMNRGRRVNLWHGLKIM